MSKSLVKVLAFALICFLVVEFSYRLYATGPVAFDVRRFNRMNQLLFTDFVKPSAYPEVYYELKPNIDDWFRGADFRTNSHGLADREHRLEKSPDTVRIVLVGSSWAMGTGVLPENNFPAVLERELNERYPDKQVEVINFGVEMYGLRELIGTLEHRAAEWQPDLVLMSVTAYTAFLKWEDPVPRKPLPEPTTPFLQSYSLRALDWVLGTGYYQYKIDERPLLEDSGPEVYRGQIARAIRELGDFSRRSGVPAYFMWLSFMDPGKLEPLMEAECSSSGVKYLPGYESIRGEQNMLQDRTISRFDSHPNTYSHQLIGNWLQERLGSNPIFTDDR